MGISLSSLNRVLKKLKAEGLILYKAGQGRSAAKFATYKTIITALRLNKSKFKEALRTDLKHLQQATVKERKDKREATIIQVKLWEDTG